MNKTNSYTDQVYNPVVTIDDLYDGNPNKDEYDVLVFIARAQPFHFGHKRVIDIALHKAKKVLVLLGSAGSPRTLRNPFSFLERMDFIEHAYTSLPKNKITFRPLNDYIYNDNEWVMSVQKTVSAFTKSRFGEYPKIGLIGCSKDSSSYYLKLFPTWGNVNVHFLNPLNATDIRKSYFGGDNTFYNRNYLPENVFVFLNLFSKTQTYKDLVAESKFIKDFHKSWENTPYPVTFNTVDSVVVQSGHILLVERGHHPGKGLFALPGGYINPRETLLESALRELREETKIKVPEPVIKGSLVKSKTYDDPNRSIRGRVITHAFHFALKNETELPKIKGSDDAKKAFWLPLSELEENKMFEDHWHIIKDMLGV